MADKDQLESVEETARRLAVSSFTVRRLIKAGQVHAVRVGKRVLVPSSEIDRIILKGTASRERTPAALKLQTASNSI